jgi:hypothetical protein
MAECGMLNMQASFPKIWDLFDYKKHGERRIALKIFVLLYNMQARIVVIYLIRNERGWNTFYAMPMKMCSFNSTN